MSQTEFKRYEYKYLLDDMTYFKLIRKLEAYMDYDIYCTGHKPYTIYNVYFDTQNNDIIKKSLDHPYYKEKLRLRSYIRASGEDIVFVELKKKIDGIVAKRRIAIRYKDLAKIFHDRENINLVEGSQNALYEIYNHIDKYDLSPKVFISYKRLALFGEDDQNFRVSFDTGIKTRRNHLGLINRKDDAILLKNKVLMEVKILGSLPLWFVDILSSLGIYRTSFSKYGSEYKIYRVKNKNTERSKDEQLIQLTS
ncbi:polyphosphate polymerase domain-containing protein [uncultured Anaerococcus sp.]|uniref:polyphosphate polymerase domain-containing protein n=1 Tax=uncultured Anaerococcus sp. TaxID=293428 RepID=UPI002620FAB2|nr:polyphosphate polymerase domain-containing protein [uncultured Anaerococcus sp.]